MFDNDHDVAAKQHEPHAQNQKQTPSAEDAMSDNKLTTCLIDWMRRP
jgi:hypothetical protein